MKDNKTKIPCVTILAFEDSVEMSITISRDVFCAASRVSSRDEGGHLEAMPVRVATQDGRAVRTFSGSTFYPDCALSEVEHSDLVIVSGVWTEIDPFLARHQPVVEWLRHQCDRGTLLASMHSGSFLLAEAGLLDEKVATVYWQMEEEFRRRFPRVIVQSERKITSSGNLFCSAGIGSGLEIGIYLVERVYGIGVAQRVSRSFLMDVHRETPEFQLVFDTDKHHEDRHILAAQQWLESNYSSDFLMEEVADKVGLGLRSFMRRFKKATGDTPLHYLHKVRIETAKELLRHSSLGIDQVSYRVGYEDVGFFCRLFKRKEHLTPGEFRSVNHRTLKNERP